MQFIVHLATGNQGPARLVFSVYNYMNIIVCSSEIELPQIPASKKLLVAKLMFPRVRLAPGKYRVNFAVRDGIEIVAWLRNALNLEITGSTTETFIYREDLEASFTFIDRQ